MQILKKSLSVFVVCALLVACLPAVTLPAQAAEAVQTNIWDIESSSVNLTGTYTDTTEQSRNNSAMTSVTGYGINQSMALKYEATEAGMMPALSVDESVEDTIFYHNPYAIFTLHDVVNVIPGVYNAETGLSSSTACMLPRCTSR